MQFFFKLFINFLIGISYLCKYLWVSKSSIPESETVLALLRVRDITIFVKNLADFVDILILCMLPDKQSVEKHSMFTTECFHTSFLVLYND